MSITTDNGLRRSRAWWDLAVKHGKGKILRVIAHHVRSYGQALAHELSHWTRRATRPYKSALLPLWRFRTVPIAKQSSQDLWERFLLYNSQNDFVGMDMARKFIQMGMTRAKRYANHKGGTKYDKESGKELEKSKCHKDKKEKEEASLVFRERCKVHEGYLDKKKAFLKEQKGWDREQKHKMKQGAHEADEESIVDTSEQEND